MLDHINSDHPNHNKKVESKQPKIYHMLGSSDKVSSEYYFLPWIALDNLAISEVEGRGFKLLLQKIASKQKIPSRHVLTRRCLPQVYRAFLNHIKSLICKNVVHYNIAIDIWTDSYQKTPYLAFVLHYVKNGMQKN